MNKRNIFKIIFAVWIVLWLLFLIRQDKDEQYSALRYLYTHDSAEKVRFAYGEELCDYLVFCGQNIPEGATYQLLGFKKFSIHEVRSRYFLWPLKGSDEDPDYKIVYGDVTLKPPGYKEFKRFGTIGRILKKV